MQLPRDPFGRIIPPAKPRKAGRAQVVSQPQAHRDFLKGIHAMANLLAPTVGPLGGRVAGSVNDNSRHELWEGSGTVVRRVISLGSADADVGAMLVRNMVWRLEQRVGDGGATAVLLTRRLAERGVRLLAAGINAMELARGMRIATEVALDAIRAQSRPVVDEDQLAHMALAVTGERELSALLGEIRYMLGAEGHVQIEKLVAPWLARHYIAGAHVGAQIASMYLYTDVAARSAVHTQSAVALLDEPLTSGEAALALAEAALAGGATSLLVIAPEISGAALNLLVSNQTQPPEKRRLGLLAVKLKATGGERADQVADLAALTGATLLGSAQGRSPLRARAQDLGRALRLEFVNDGLAILPLPERRQSVRQEAEAIGQRLALLPFNAHERPALVRRLATMTGGLAVLKVGASSERERARLHATAERALKVLTAAQRGGAVPGGGAALVHAAPAVRALAADSTRLAGDQAFGARLLAESLDAPMAQIARNAGVDHPAAVVARVAEAGAPWAWDAHTGAVVDAHTSGLLDATEVTTAVLSGAVSAALMALTTDTIVYHRNPQQSLEP
jgi:chaperonin GroEL